ncbi:hypothetical protein Q9Q99_10405 [Curtobacterium flaccumfaciens]|nr:hypothetical protein Q9Q99_10405 [Curtobacterium flaccumfaciens]
MSEHSVHHARWTRLTTDALYGIVVLRNRVFALEQRGHRRRLRRP